LPFLSLPLSSHLSVSLSLSTSPSLYLSPYCLPSLCISLSLSFYLSPSLFIYLPLSHPHTHTTFQIYSLSSVPNVGNCERASPSLSAHAEYNINYVKLPRFATDERSFFLDKRASLALVLMSVVRCLKSSVRAPKRIARRIFSVCCSSRPQSNLIFLFRSNYFRFFVKKMKPV